MALQGHVKTISLIEIFQFLSACQHTGTLTVQSRGLTRVVYFVGGAIHLPRLEAFTVGRIGDFLVRQGKIGVEKVYSALEEQKNTGRLLGNILVDRGDLTADELEQALRNQYEEEIYQVFIWDDATFAFEKEVVPDAARDPAASIVLKADSLLMEAARRTDEWERLLSAIPSLKTIFCMREGAQAAVEQQARDRRLNIEADLINGQRSVLDIFARCREGQFQMAEFLHALIVSDLIFELPGGEVPDHFRHAIKAGNFEFAIALILHGQTASGCDPGVIRELEATLLKTRTFLRATDRISIPVLREGPALVEFILTVIKNMMTGVLVARTGSSELVMCCDKQHVRLSSSNRDVLQLEKWLSSDTTISPIDVKRLVLQTEKSPAQVSAVLESSGNIDPRKWQAYLLQTLFKEIYGLALAPGIDVTFAKNAPVEDYPVHVGDLIVELTHENTFFELTDGLSRWVERAEVLPILDMVLTETGHGAPDRTLMTYINGRSSVRDIIERSREDAVTTYNALVDIVDSGHARPLDVGEMMDTVQYFLGNARPAEALRLCRAAQASNLDPETFADVEAAILEEQGDMSVAAKEYRLSGDAGDFSLAEVLQSLHTHGKSGTLKITDGTDEREIYFEKGHVRYLRTEDAEKSNFGSQILDFDLQDMTEGLFGNEQIPTGEVSEDEVPDALCQQIKEEIYDTFIWDNASFIFTANYFPAEYHAPSPTTTKLQLATDRFMIQAVSIILDWEAIQKAFSMKTIFKFVSSEAKMAAVKDLGKPEVLYLVDGRLAVKSIVRRSGLDKLQVSKMLFDLLQAEWIEALTVDDLLSAATFAIEKNDDPGALTYLGYALELDPGNQEVRDAIEQISGQSAE